MRVGSLVTTAPRTLGLAAAVAATLALGCDKNRKLDAPPQATGPKLAPGAARWAPSAQQLPQGAPVVLTARVDALVGGVGRLYEWLLAEPAMFGQGVEGEQRVRGLVNAREQLEEELGFDPLTPEAWERWGLDITRPAYLGIYPPAPRARSLSQDIEAALLEGLEVEGAAALEAKLEQGPAPTGLYSELSRLVREAQGPEGIARVVVALRDEARALDVIDSVASRLDWSRGDQAVGISRLYYTSAEDGVMALVVRIEAGRMALDWLRLGRLDATAEDPRRAEALARAQALLKEQGGPGHPRAPAPLDPDAALSLSIDQDGYVRELRRRHYAEAVSAASAEAAADRDAALLRAVRSARRAGDPWRTEGLGLTGITYELAVGGEARLQERLFGLRMGLFASEGLEAPARAGAGPGLSVEQRILGVSLDPAVLLGPQWKKWLAPAQPGQALDLLEETDEGAPVSISAAAYLLSLPRNFAVVITSFEDIIRAQAPIDVLPLYAQREHLARLDLVVPGADLKTLRLRPRFLGLLLMRPGTEPLDRDAVSAALRDTLHMAWGQAEELRVLPPPDGGAAAEEAGAAEESPPEPESYDRAEPLESDRLRTFDAPAGHPLGQTMYYYARGAERPWILFGHGIDEEALRDELSALESGEGAGQGQSVYMRAEPAGLVQLASTYRPASLSFLDLAILAQRVGPLRLSVDAPTEDAPHALRYSFELLAPPALE